MMRLHYSSGFNGVVGIVALHQVNPFISVREWDSQFLGLFPHRYDYIWAVHPNPGAKPEWQTETRHPLADRTIQQGSQLYGVRFGTETNYAMLDIDIGSRYHPRQDPFGVDRLLLALEPLGLISTLTIQSSHSGGLHLYFPFEQAQTSWKIALAISTLLENAGFKLYPGQLEIFPNPKPYATDGKPSLFGAHRLPLQMGSYLLDRDYQPVAYSQNRFVEQWTYCTNRNDLDKKQLDRLIKQIKRRCFKLSGKADKFLNDLNAEIELGWTGYGQTNRLLGRVAMRTYVFHHILHGGEPLTGDQLVQEITAIAKALPGYQDWCQHQHEITHRTAEWARCVEESHYFPYGTKATSQPKDNETIPTISYNQQRLEDARTRIREAIADLLNRSALPSKATERFKSLLNYAIGGGSLYRHKDLWHPTFLNSHNLTINPPEDWHSPTNLLDAIDGNSNISNASSDIQPASSTDLVGNTFPIVNSLPSYENIDQAVWLDIRQAAASEMLQNSFNPLSAMPVDRMQQQLYTDDPILVAEAWAWAQQHPDIPIQIPSPSLAEQMNIDCSDQLVAISIQVERLGWSKAQVQAELQRRFGCSRSVYLSPMQLAEWLAFLAVQSC
jgi:hypothetical protein